MHQGGAVEENGQTVEERSNSVEKRNQTVEGVNGAQGADTWVQATGLRSSPHFPRFFFICLYPGAVFLVGTVMMVWVVGQITAAVQQ